MARFVPFDPIISGLNPPSAKHALQVSGWFMVGFVPIYPTVHLSNGLNQSLAKLSLKVRRVTSSLYSQAYESRGVVTLRGILGVFPSVQRSTYV